MHPLRPSNGNRAKECPASPWREADLPNPDSPEAKEGRRLHGVNAEVFRDEFGDAPETAGAYARLYDTDKEIVGRCLGFLKARIEALRETIPAAYLDEAVLVVHVEQHLDIPGMDQGGTADVIAYWAIGAKIVSDILIIDWKTGRALNDCPAERDVQMLAYSTGARAWLFNEEMGGTASVSVQAYRYHPRLAYEDRVASCTFGGSLEAWVDCIEILLALRRAVDQPSPPAVAGRPQCDFCRAKTTCPEFKTGLVEPVMALAKTDRAVALSPEDIGRVLDLAKTLAVVKTYVESAQDMAREAIANGAVYPAADGKVWALKAGAKKRKIPDTVEAFRRLGIPPAEFLAACGLRLGDSRDGSKGIDSVVRAHLKATGDKWTVKQAKEWMAETLEDALVFQDCKPSLVAVAPTTSTCG